MIIIEHARDGALAGRIDNLDSESIELGRSDSSDVAFDLATERSVSSRHARIVVVDGALVVEDLGSTNGTYVNGQRVERPKRIAPEDEVRLGQQGPGLRARYQGARQSSGVMATFAEGEVDALPATFVGAEQEDFSPAAKARPHAGAAGQQHGAGQTKAGELAAAGAGNRRSIGMNTMMGVIDNVTRRERKRTFGIVVGLVIAGGAALGWVRMNSSGGGSDFRPVFDAVQDSVYVVVRRSNADATASESGFGTAWSVAPGLLATNGHVAELFSALEDGEVMIARSNSDEPHDLRISGIRIHPGYQGFQDLVTEYLPYDPNGNDFLQAPPAYDVALLEVLEEDVALQAEPLKLASSEELAVLEEGQPVGYLGFPTEGVMRGGTDLRRPSAKTATGPLCRAVDVFLGRPESSSDAHCLEYNIETVGGGSGSPVFNDAGHVIGLINSGDVLGSTSRGRIGTGGTTYGPRSDVLGELLAEEADAVWSERGKDIATKLAELFRVGVSDPRGLAKVLGGPVLADKANADQVSFEGVLEVIDVETLDVRSEGSSTDWFRLDADGEGVYGVVILATDSPGELVVSVGDTGNAQRFESGDGTYWSSLSFPTSFKAKDVSNTRFAVSSLDSGDDAPRKAAAVLLRLR